MADVELADKLTPEYFDLERARNKSLTNSQSIKGTKNLAGISKLPKNETEYSKKGLQQQGELSKLHFIQPGPNRHAFGKMGGKSRRRNKKGKKKTNKRRRHRN
jgi:hypothetical protein